MRTESLPLSLFAALLIVSESHGATATPRPATSKPAFDFVYEEGWGTKLDTYRATMTKDLVADRDTTIHFKLSQADMDSVRQTMVEIGFFKMREPHPPWRDCRASMDPSTTIRVESTMDSTTRRLFWNTTDAPCYGNEEGDWEGLRKLQELILRIVMRQPAYGALPKPRGVYL